MLGSTRDIFIQSLTRLYRDKKITRERVYALLQQKTITLEEYRKILDQEDENCE